jgi:beta-mannosidase
VLRRTSLNKGWRFAAKRWLPLPKRLAFSSLEWLPAEVPGHVHVDLQRASVIASPLAELNELGSQWIDEEDWCFECTLEFTPDPALPRRVLRFEGLDTVCVVLLNGERIAEHDNMFVPLEVDVSSRLRAGSNVLRVEFESAERVGRARRERYLTAEQLPLNIERFDERAFLRKAQYMFGWDWGPRLISAGIWQPVKLLEFSARILDVHIEQQHHADGSVELRVVSQVEGEGLLQHTLVLDGMRRTFRDGQTLRIDKPALWWPLAMGEAKLYTLETVLLPPGVDPALAASESPALDRQTTRIGLRQVELVQEADEFGRSFGFVVNGRKLWALGANWIPDHSFPSLVTRERTRAQLERARDLGMNMLRIWGGGLYESDDFYDACDELGILVWQDFPFACNYAPDDHAAQAVMKTEAISAVRRLRNRASLAIWCGNNENRTMFESKWGDKQLHPPRYYGEHIWDGTLPAVLRELDPGRPYVSSSPLGGPSANADEEGDQHNWDVWHGRGDWVHYKESRGRFISEFGFASAPGRAAWRIALGPQNDIDTLDPRHALARWHDKTAKGYETFISYVELHYPVARTLAEWSYYSQLNQRDAMRCALEHYRSARFCQGALIWQLNDCWPVQSWALLDSEAEYKAAAFEMRRLFAPALAAVQLDENQARVVVALDNTSAPLDTELRVEVCSLSDGQELAAQTAQVQLTPGERKEVLIFDLRSLPREQVTLTATLLGVSSTRLLCEPKQARFATPKLSASFNGEVLALDSDVPVLDLFVFSDEPGFELHDNFVSLPAAGRALLRCRGRATRLRARSLLGEHVVALK